MGFLKSCSLPTVAGPFRLEPDSLSSNITLTQYGKYDLHNINLTHFHASVNLFFVQFVFFFIFPYFYFDISRSILKNSKIPILWCYQLLIRNRRAKWLSVWPNAASQLIRSGLHHSWYKQVPTHCLLLCAIEAGDLLDSVKKHTWKRTYVNTCFEKVFEMHTA